MANPRICWLGQPACHDRGMVGGKAAHLSQLAAAFRVPPGFCLTSATFEEWISRGVVDEVGLAADRLPQALYEELSHAYTILAEQCGVTDLPVAVRSSAFAEDGVGSSFAGQHTTVLNVRGAEAIAAAVLQCWGSAFSTRVQAYRAHQGLAKGGARMAVLVQQFVNADCSVVLFSADPVTGRRDELVINAAWGLGESIVGGTVTPDTYRLCAADLSVITQQVAAKRRMTVAIPGGTREVDVPRFLQRQPALSSEQVAELCQLGRDLEMIGGQPVDAECAYQNGSLYLLQCRPITALSSLSTDTPTAKGDC